MTRIDDPRAFLSATLGGGGNVDADETIGAGFGALLQELAQLLDNFAENGERGAIDLHSLPMASDEHDRLKALLGRGEVTATVNLGSPTTVYETTFHGIWWVHYSTPDGDTEAEYLEVAAVPEILFANAIDARRDVSRLRARIPSSGDQVSDEKGVAYE